MSADKRGLCRYLNCYFLKIFIKLSNVKFAHPTYAKNSGIDGRNLKTYNSAELTFCSQFFFDENSDKK